MPFALDESDHVQFSPQRCATHRAAQFDAIQTRHLEIGQENLGRRCNEISERLLAIGGLLNVVTRADECAIDQKTIGFAIVHEQDP